MSMERERINRMLLFSPIGTQPQELPALTPHQYHELPALRQIMERVHLYAPGQLAERFGWAMAARMVALLNREEALRSALRRYESQGIHPLVQGDADYPEALAEKLGTGGNALPLVFMVSGDTSLLRESALSITGSREPTADMRRFTSQLAARCAGEGLVLCEGGAWGVDQVGERAILDAGGRCVCFHAVAMTQRLKVPHLARAVWDGQMLLLTSARPEDPFERYRALHRNHYIAAQGRALVAVGPRCAVGGTWACASDNLKAGWTPDTRVFGGEGASALCGLGARPIASPDELDWQALRAH